MSSGRWGAGFTRHGRASHRTGSFTGGGPSSLVVDPGFGVLSKDRDALGEITFGEVGEGDGFEDGAEVGADGDPDLLQGFGGAWILHGLRPLAPDVSQRSFDGAYHLGQRYILGGAGQPVAAGRPAAGAYDTRALQVVQDVLHELLGDTLGLGDPLPFNGPRSFCRRARQLGGGPQRVISLGRNLQAPSHPRKIELLLLRALPVVVVRVAAIRHVNEPVRPDQYPQEQHYRPGELQVLRRHLTSSSTRRHFQFYDSQGDLAGMGITGPFLSLNYPRTTK